MSSSQADTLGKGSLTISQADLARVLQVSRETIRKWDRLGLKEARVGKTAAYDLPGAVAWRLGQVKEGNIGVGPVEGLEGLDPSVYPDEIDETPVKGWLTQRKMSEWYGYSTRQIQRFERKGLPSHGTGPGKRYPRPHAVAWILHYRFLTQHLGRQVDYLPWELAVAESNVLTMRTIYREELKVRGG